MRPSVSSAPATLEIVAGDAQEAPATLATPNGPTVLVRDSAGVPQPGQAVTFRVRDGDGWLVSEHGLTDSTGHASAAWYLGPRPGRDNALEAIAGPGLTVRFTARTTALELARSYPGLHGYIEYVPGDLPVVLSVPHGGGLRPDDIPDRQLGATSADVNTLEVALAAVDEFLRRTGGRPHLIICHLHRIKLDANRELAVAAQGQTDALIAWREFHAFIEAARIDVLDRFGLGMYVDVHGHAHPQPLLELGYLVHADLLAGPDSVLDLPEIAQTSSLRTLVELSGAPLSGLVRGPGSLGALFDRRGYLSVPGPMFPHPGSNPFFQGGYNTARHGSLNGGPISGVQIEAPYPGFRDTPENQIGFGTAIATVFDDFFAYHFGAWPAKN